MQQTVNTQSKSVPSIASRPLALVDLTVIIVNYNVCEFLEQALRSVERASRGLSVEVFVVDNNSVDGSVQMVRSRFPDVCLISNENNVGFSRANNLAIRQGRGRYLLILNPDTIVREDTFSSLIQFMEQHPDAGAAGCKILNPDGSFARESRRAFPTPEVAFYRIVGLSRLFPRSQIFGRYNLTFLPEDQVAEVDALSGSCMLVRRAALYYSRAELAELTREDVDADLILPPYRDATGYSGAGLLDENFFMYGEDLDWCFRIQKAGWKIFYTPQTQIIHYKGESTKKGELRYVKLFYGAMLRFTEKHFQSNYSRLFAHVLRLAIVGRAAMSIASTFFRRLRVPVLDFTLVYLVTILVGMLRSAEAGAGLSYLFFLSVAPAYGLGSVLGIAGVGGYRPGRRSRLRPVFFGVTMGFLTVVTASFFIKEIAFSRAVVLLSLPVAIAVLSTRRLLFKKKKPGRRRVVLVGNLMEAKRFQNILDARVDTPLSLVGFVSPEGKLPSGISLDPCFLGSSRQLRDLVRLRSIDEVVFAASSVSNHAMFRLMQLLRDLPVQFKILTEGQQHIIGKASIEDLSLPSLIEIDDTLGKMSSPATQRLFEMALSTGGLLAFPFIWFLGRILKRKGLLRLSDRLRLLPHVWTGTYALVGIRPTEKIEIPQEWGLKTGIFSIVDAFPVHDLTPQETTRAYWFYTRNQSSSLDWDIILRSIQNTLR